MGGCALQDGVLNHQGRSKQQDEYVTAHINQFKRSVQSREHRLAAQHVNKPWVAGKPIALSRELSLPLALRRNVDTTLLFANESVDLVQLAQRIAQTTDIPVTVKPDALLPAEMFAPRSGATSLTGKVLLPTQAAFLRGPQPLAKMLDALSRRLDVQWKYEDATIIFFRTQTQAFDVRLLTMAASTEMSLGRSAAAKSGGFDNSARTTLRAAEQNSLEALKIKIEPFMTKAGVIAAQAGAASSLVVTDTPAALRQIAKFIETENRALTRRIRLVFEEITVEAEDEQGFGLDWDLAFTAEKLVTSVVSSGASLVTDANRALLELQTDTKSPAKLVVQALSKQAKVLRHTTVPIVTLNRRPVTHAVRTTFSYIDQVKTSALSSHGQSGQALPSVSVSQKEETVGAFLTILPDAQADGQIMLSIAYDNTVAQPIKTISFGGPNQKLDIQQIVIEGNGTVHQLALKSGYPMLISGFERKQSQSDHARLLPEMPLVAGGSDNLAHKKVVTMIMLTAYLEEGW